MARVTYESKDHAGHKFWVARYGRYAIRIDATRRGVYPWLITLEGRSVRKGVAPDRDEARRCGERCPRRAAPLEVVDVMLADRELGRRPRNRC